jgi:hypothetical protein
MSDKADPLKKHCETDALFGPILDTPAPAP